MVEVESSIVLKKLSMFVPLSSSSSIYNLVADDKVELLNLSFPVPGSLSEVVVSKV